jgi:hypothetical protein
LQLYPLHMESKFKGLKKDKRPYHYKYSVFEYLLLGIQNVRYWFKKFKQKNYSDLETDNIYGYQVSKDLFKTFEIHFDEVFYHGVVVLFDYKSHDVIITETYYIWGTEELLKEAPLVQDVLLEPIEEKCDYISYLKDQNTHVRTVTGVNRINLNSCEKNINKVLVWWLSSLELELTKIVNSKDDSNIDFTLEFLNDLHKRMTTSLKLHEFTNFERVYYTKRVDLLEIQIKWYKNEIALSRNLISQGNDVKTPPENKTREPLPPLFDREKFKPTSIKIAKLHHLLKDQEFIDSMTTLPNFRKSLFENYPEV